MAGQGVFNVTFGINETSLTRALELRHYNQARRLIVDNSHSTFLDEGCYQRTPLYIVLCGKDNGHNASPRNFHFAKLLVENGADVNYRVPAMSCGGEYVDPGQSALELTIDLFNHLTSQSAILSDEEDPYDLITLPYEIIGLDNHQVIDYNQCLDQLLSLLQIILAHSGDLSVRDWHGMTPLHRTVVFSCDLRITELLVDWHANLNARDVFGNTPLAALCEAFPLGVDCDLEDDDEEEVVGVIDEPVVLEEEDLDQGELLFCQRLCARAFQQDGKDNFRTFLLQQSDTDVNSRNHRGRTPLFSAVLRGDSATAQDLLKYGADPTIKSPVSTVTETDRSMSPIFVSLFSMRTWGKSPETLNFGTSQYFMAHLVDQGFFSRPEIVDELLGYIDADFPAFRHLKPFGIDLLELLFGGVTASLRQLAARAVLGCYLGGRPRVALAADGFNQLKPGHSDVATTSSRGHSLSAELVRQHGLPHSSILHLDAELLRKALFTKFATFAQAECERLEAEADDLSDEGSGMGENDSDLEYW